MIGDVPLRGSREGLWQHGGAVVIEPPATGATVSNQSEAENQPLSPSLPRLFGLRRLLFSGLVVLFFAGNFLFFPTSEDSNSFRARLSDTIDGVFNSIDDHLNKNEAVLFNSRRTMMIGSVLLLATGAAELLSSLWKRSAVRSGRTVDLTPRIRGTELFFCSLIGLVFLLKFPDSENLSSLAVSTMSVGIGLLITSFLRRKDYIQRVKRTEESVSANQPSVVPGSVPTNPSIAHFLAPGGYLLPREQNSSSNVFPRRSVYASEPYSLN
ncbi:hypothetical protein cyc_00856 [Cyclospora cayetanensis]|uniref:Transmembrane protein n=1 Tax=Cyclospora cayetanensis TaxID=88456 RepID=A0A1D3CUP1_9EIME|nr:hypothetical protein cyc_00856 [Cyclospora cayetanensis]